MTDYLKLLIRVTSDRLTDLRSIDLVAQQTNQHTDSVTSSSAPRSGLRTIIPTHVYHMSEFQSFLLFPLGNSSWMNLHLALSQILLALQPCKYSLLGEYLLPLSRQSSEAVAHNLRKNSWISSNSNSAAISDVSCFISGYFDLLPTCSRTIQRRYDQDCQNDQLQHFEQYL